MALAGKQLASDRKGSAMRGLSRAPKPTKKWRTCKGRREWEAAQASDPLTLQPCWVTLLGSRGRHHREWDSRSWELEGGKRETGDGGASSAGPAFRPGQLRAPTKLQAQLSADTKLRLTCKKMAESFW